MHLPRDGRLSIPHLTDLYPDIDVADATSLLNALELCSVVATGSSYQLSCLNSLPVPDEDQNWTCSRCVGGVALAADSTAQLRFVFPRVQHAIWSSPVVAQVTEWGGGIRFQRSSGSSENNTVTVQINSVEDKDLIHITCCGDSPQTLYELQQMTVATVLRMIDACCPGLYLQLNALSPRDIRQGRRPLPRTYTPRDVAVAQLNSTQEVGLDGDEVGESLKQMLAFDDEAIYAALRPGIELHVSKLPIHIRCRLAALLDPPHPHGRDWLLLAVGLGLSEAIPHIDSSEMASLSHTVCLLALWSRQHDATIRRLLDVIQRTVQRPDVEEALLQMTPLCQPPTINPRPSASSSPDSKHFSAADRSQSHGNSRKSSTTSA